MSPGHFNESTARIYTDYTLFTANEGISKEINKVFNFFDVSYRVKSYKHLVVSPHYTVGFCDRLVDNEVLDKS